MQKKSELFALIYLIFAFQLFAASISHDPQQKDPLEQRWTRASQQAKAQGWKDYWIGYSVKKMMYPNEFVYTGMHLHGEVMVSKNAMTLEELIYGIKVKQPLHPEKAEEAIKKEAARMLTNLEHPGKIQGNKVPKEIAILVHFAPSLKELEVINVAISFDFEGKPLYWLGQAEDEQSISILGNLYKQTSSIDIKENIVFSIASHGDVTKTSPFLLRILKSNEPDSIREEAASGFGQQDNESALQTLLQVMRNDRSEDVREEALDGIASMSIPAARKVLIDMAQHFSDHQLRLDAISMLSRTESEIALLKRLVLDDPDEEVREEALDMLFEFKAIPILIDVAKNHPSHQTRSSAIDLLGESKDPAARKALIEIVKNEE